MQSHNNQKKRLDDHRANDVGMSFDLLNDCMEGEMLSEHVWRISTCLALECDATTLCSDLNALQSHSGRES